MKPSEQLLRSAGAILSSDDESTAGDAKACAAFVVETAGVAGYAQVGGDAGLPRSERAFRLGSMRTAASGATTRP